MIKKILLWFLILIILYGLSVFLFPNIASTIDSIVGAPWFSEKFRGGKESFDTAITDIPQLEEVKDTFVDGVGTTKEKIDTIRSGAQKAQETIEEGKQTFSDAKEVFDDASAKVDQLQGIMNDVKNLTGSSSVSNTSSVSK